MNRIDAIHQLRFLIQHNEEFSMEVVVAILESAQSSNFMSTSTIHTAIGERIEKGVLYYNLFMGLMLLVFLLQADAKSLCTVEEVLPKRAHEEPWDVFLNRLLTPSNKPSTFLKHSSWQLSTNTRVEILLSDSIKRTTWPGSRGSSRSVPGISRLSQKTHGFLEGAVQGIYYSSCCTY